MCGQQDEHYPGWDDPFFHETSDTQWVARYRRLQSWYRDVVLDAPPGRYHGKLRGNHLDETWLADHPDANFLNEDIARYVAARAPLVQNLGGTLEEKRLRRNLMSSQPLCFNLFGYLRAHMREAAAPLATAFNLNIAQITLIEVEVPAPYLDDRTAFDAAIEYKTPDGRRGFIGVETKYTEKFSPKKIDKPRYREVTAWPDSGFKPGAADALLGSKTNQLWRNAMLTIAHKKAESFDLAHVAVVYCANDPKLDEAIALFSTQLTDQESLLRTVTYEQLIESHQPIPTFRTWATEFHRRYLNLSFESLPPT